MNRSSFADHFSENAARYARFRPGYPSELFAWLGSASRERRRAWDCGTGNGQAAVGLADHFADVVATDASEAQVAAAVAHQRVRYLCTTAEQSGLADRSVNLVTVAQALHWFDVERFYREVERIVVPGGVIAVWSYGHVAIEPAIDAEVYALYSDTLGPWWPMERSHVENGYRDLPFPFDAITTPAFAMRAEWTVDALLGYVSSWSAFQRYRKANGDAALRDFAVRLADRWGNPRHQRTVRWPLMMRAGRVGV